MSVEPVPKSTDVSGIFDVALRIMRWESVNQVTGFLPMSRDENPIQATASWVEVKR
jgi:hypothetical protein